MILCVSASAAEPSRHYKAEGRRDPFVPLIAGGVRPSGSLMSVEGPDDLIMEGIAFEPTGSVVLVNGSILREGEVVGNTKVVRIEANRAIFEVSGVETIKEVYPNSAGGQ